jgi:signal transduction histidine kinase
MKERAELMGGTFEIESEIGKGTTIYVRIQASAIREKRLNNE